MNSSYHKLSQQIDKIPFIDTHEHLVDESERLNALKPWIQCDDWTTTWGLYTKFDLVAAGMPISTVELMSAEAVAPIDKWKAVQAYWDAIKYSAYGQVIRHTIKDLYGIDQLSEDRIVELQAQYESFRKAGFYKEVLQKANIKFCIVNPPGRPFKESESPDMLYQDIDVLGMIKVDVERYNENILPSIHQLADWLEIINWWFKQYANKAVGIKIGIAYFRRLNFEKVERNIAEDLFSKKLTGKELSASEEKSLQDFLFWYVVDIATKNDLPVKLHMGQQAMNNYMNLEEVMFNPSDGANICRLSPKTTFVFYHIAYPYYEPMIALAKHYSNAYIDMCWAWTLNPLASIDFLKKYIMSAPINKLTAFGGDDVYIENLVGHAKLARKGIFQALSELVSDAWITEEEAIEIAHKIMWQNAEQIYKLY